MSFLRVLNKFCKWTIFYSALYENKPAAHVDSL